MEQWSIEEFARKTEKLVSVLLPNNKDEDKGDGNKTVENKQVVFAEDRIWSHVLSFARTTK